MKKFIYFLFLPTLLSIGISGCSKINERKLVGFWDLKSIEVSSDNGKMWKQYAPGGKDFLNLMPDGRGAYGDPTGVGKGADDVVWSCKGDSLFYYSPEWKPMDGETRARIVRCDSESLILEKGNTYRFNYSKRR